MGIWTFLVPIAPRGAGRHRVTVVAGHARTYADPATRKWEQQVAFAAGSVLPRQPLEGPIRVDVLILIERPQRLLVRSKRTGELLHASEGLMWAPVKPDRDNVDKAVLDGLRSHWRDDSQVVFGGIAKCYTEATGKPRVIVRISELEASVPDGLTALARHWSD